MKNIDKYAAQKKHLSEKKQLRVWVASDKYQSFKEAVEKQGESIYGVINHFIDQYISLGEAED